MGKKKNSMSDIAKLLMGSREKIRLAKNEEDEAKCNCPHQSPSGKPWVRARKNNNSGKPILKCNECKVKIDLTPIINKSIDDKKKYIKGTCNDFINLCNISKLTLSGDKDQKYLKMLSKAQYFGLKVKQFAKMILINGGEPGHKKNKKKNKAQTNFILSGGGASY